MQAAPNRCYGRADLPLADGWQEALDGLVDRLRPIGPHAVCSSSSSRCALPARALAERLGVPLQLDPRLLELDFGDWDGLDWDEVPRAGLDRWAADPLAFAPPGGESGSALVERITAVQADLLAHNRPCLLVSHGGPLRLLGPMLAGAPPDLLAPAPAMGTLQIIEARTAASRASAARPEVMAGRPCRNLTGNNTRLNVSPPTPKRSPPARSLADHPQPPVPAS